MLEYLGGLDLDLTEGEIYEMIDASGEKVKIEDDSGSLIWVPEDCFKEV